MKIQSSTRYALLLIFTACIVLSFRFDKQSALEKQYEYSFGYESVVPGKLVSNYHKIIVRNDQDMEYQHCKISYRSGNFQKPTPVDTLKITGKYSFSEKKGLLTLKMGSSDSGLDFPLSGDYQLADDVFTCLVKNNNWFYNHPIFEIEHFEKCSTSSSHRQNRQIKNVYHNRTIEMWTCETEHWALDFELK